MVEQAKTEAEVKVEPEVEDARTPEERLEALEEVIFELIDRVEKLTKEYEGFKKQAVTKPKGLFGGKRTPTPMKDLKTGIVYPSKAAVGKSLAPEAGAEQTDTMAYYTVMKVLKMPDGSDRFVEASEEEAKKAREDYQREIEAQVAAANARLEAERAAGEGTPVPKPAPKPQPKKR